MSQPHTFVRPRLALILCLLGLALLVAPAPTAQAATITVIQTSDGSANPANCPGTLCRLRDAIAKAGSGDTINFAFTSATIMLTQGQLLINKDLTITVSGTCDVSIDAQGASRVFDVAAGKRLTINGVCIQNGAAPSTGNGGGIRVQSGATLNLSNLTIQDNQATGAGPRGGAIYNAGTLNISGFAFFSGNFAGTISSLNDGGAIYNDGAATLSGTTDSTGIHSISFFSNHASLDGGTIYNNGTMTVTSTTVGPGGAFSGGGVYNSGTLTVLQSLISQNNAATAGGGIYNSSSGTLTVTDSTLALNGATNNGAGIYNEGTVNIHRSTLTGNVSDATGGGISNTNGGTLTISNGTISGNDAKDDGGGIWNSGASSTANLNNVTVARNTADSDSTSGGNGGGIFNSAGTVNVKNTIMSGNTDDSAGTKHPDCSGTLNSQGYNLLRIDTGCTGLNASGDQVGTSGNPLNALLDTLAANGGPTQTHALLPGSPAINKGNPAVPGSGGGACAALDQRSYPLGAAAGRCDIGAFERVFLLDLPIVFRQ